MFCRFSAAVSTKTASATISQIFTKGQVSSMDREFDAFAYLNGDSTFDDHFYLLPEDVQERVNARAQQRDFRSDKELRRYVEDLLRRA